MAACRLSPRRAPMSRRSAPFTGPSLINPSPGRNASPCAKLRVGGPSGRSSDGRRGGVTGRIILDGGMGRELWRRGVEVPPTLWSANALLAAPQTVQQIHQDYIAAGADIITLNNYSLVPGALAACGLADRLDELLALSLRLARAARERAGRAGVRIAGALPPLANSYRADLVPPVAEAVPIYRRLVASLADGIDLLPCEPMS